ncbi:30S ribosomal protein S7 [Candidatus Parcubacteria bacterium]|nr:MAG: 30S ribosomal protein S7 [Candidatus Parcubacteria bacterium]
MRHKPAPKRNIAPDPKYKSVLVARLINRIMTEGKKTTAQRVVYGAFNIIKEKTKADPLAIFEQAVSNAAPQVEVKSRRIGGANYQVPREVRGERRITLALRWIVDAARGKKGKSMGEKLAEELTLAAKKEGSAVKKREDTHKMAEANRAFAHFAW